MENRIRDLRIERGMTQEELGKAVGLKRAAINKYEKGVVVNIKQETIMKLAEQNLGTLLLTPLLAYIPTFLVT